MPIYTVKYRTKSGCHGDFPHQSFWVQDNAGFCHDVKAGQHNVKANFI